MAEAEVKIKATMDFAGDYDALDKQVEALKKLRAEAREMERMGAPREAAKITRKANAMERSIDREGARLLRLEDDEDKRAKKAPIEATKDRLSRGLVEEAEARKAGNHAAADAMAKETAVMQRALTLQRTRNVSQKEAMDIAREELALKRAGVGVATPKAAASLGSVLMQAGAGAFGAQVFGDVVDQMAQSQSLGLRRTATAAGNARQAAILAARGTSGQTAAAAWAAEDNVAELRRNRPQLQSDQKFGALSAAGQGAAWGAGVGAMVGSAVPVLGTAVGAVVGGGIGAAAMGIPAWMTGGNKVKQSEQDEAQEAEKAAKLSELAAKQFNEQEGGLMMDKLRARSKRSMAGQREAFANEMAEQWLQTYRDVYNKSNRNTKMAQEAANLTVDNSMRDRQAQAGAGLVDAYTGGAGIAAAAKWATQSGGWSEVGTKIDGLRGSVEAGNREYQTINQAK